MVEILQVVANLHESFDSISGKIVCVISEVQIVRLPRVDNVKGVDRNLSKQIVINCATAHQRDVLCDNNTHFMSGKRCMIFIVRVIEAYSQTRRKADNENIYSHRTAASCGPDSH
jgi:hypothetical protein